MQHQAAAWIRDKLITLPGTKPRSVALFGSAVRGQLRCDSDIDLLLIGEGIPRKAFLRAQWISPLLQAWRNTRLQWNMPYSLSPLMLSEAGWTASIGLQLSLCGQAWVLWDDGFLSASLNTAAQLIQEGYWVKRNFPSGGWAWIPVNIQKGSAA